MRKSLVIGFMLIFLGLALCICSQISFRNSCGFGVRHGNSNPVSDIIGITIITADLVRGKLSTSHKT